MAGMCNKGFKYSMHFLVMLMLTAVFMTSCSGSVPDAGKTGVPTETDTPVDGVSIQVFEGNITNKDLKPGTLTGEVVYDKNCVYTENGMMECDGGIYTREFGLLNFHYSHNMKEEDCLGPKQVVSVVIKDNNTAAVYREVNQ